MYDLKKHYNADRNEILKNIDKTLSSGRLVLGPELDLFEKNFSRFCDAKYSVGVSSGSMGLIIALKCIDLKKNDEVITVANSDIPTSHAITINGAKIKWVDIEESTLTIDPKEIEKNITSNTKVILPVHLFGVPANMLEIKKIAKKYNLKIIEDACLATGAKIGSKKIGSIGDLTVFSFNPGKILDGIGPGGIITTNSKKFYNKLIKLRDYGKGNVSRIKDGFSKIIGFNSKLSNVNATILNLRLKKIRAYIKKREENVKLYKQYLNLDVNNFQNYYKKSQPVWRNFTIKIDNRNLVYNFLKKKGIDTFKGYYPPNHLDKCYKDLPRVQLPITEKTSKQILNLPCHPYMNKNEIIKISKYINQLI